MAIYNTKYEDEAEQMLTRAKALIKKGALVIMSEKHPQRTLKQNSYLRVILAYFASQYGCSVEEAKLDFYERRWNADIFVRKIYNKQGKQVNSLRSTTELTTAEMSTSIDRFRHFSQLEFGVYLPSPEDRDYLIYCEQEIERNKEFISVEQDDE